MDNLEILYDKSKLAEIINFVGDGFKWPKSRRDAFYEKLKKNPDDIPIAAFAKSEDKITMAILIIYQGNISSSDKKILNLASWYALPNKRGADVLIFSKFFINSLKEFIITNYTANDSVKKILRAFGFKNMPVKIVNFQLFPKINKTFLKYLFKIRNNEKKSNNFYKCLKNLYPIENYIYSKNDDEYIGYFSTWIFKKFGISWKFLNIYIETNNNFEIPSTYSIIKLMVKNFSIGIRIYYKNYNRDDKSRPWLIFGGEDYDYYIFPNNSELEVQQ